MFKEDKENYEHEVIEKAKRAKDQWETDVKEKAALQECSVFDYTSEFESMIMSARKIVHEKLCKEEDEAAELEAEKGKLARARRVSTILYCVTLLINIICSSFTNYSSLVLLSSHSARRTRSAA